MLSKITPVVVVNEPQSAVRLAELYLESGISTIEITLRTSGALDCVKAVKAANLGIRLGVGTITTRAEAEAAASLDVDFLVSPATSAGLLDFASSSTAPVYLGFSTVSEALRLIDSGLQIGKFFPAKTAGGAEFLRALGAVLPKFHVFPTGGIELADVPNYLALPNVFQVGGSWLAPKEKIKNQNWAAIEQILQQTQQYLANYEREQK